MYRLVEEILALYVAHIYEGGCWVSPDLVMASPSVEMDDEIYSYFIHHFQFSKSVEW